MSINPTSAPIVSPIDSRYSPYRFDHRPIEKDKLKLCFEAAGWAASSFNEQPWRWIVAIGDDEQEFKRMLGCLLESNQAWAADAGALVLTAYRPRFSRNDNPNRVALHDLGQASAHLAIQAASMGLQIHQMGGVNLSQIRTEYQIPDDFEPATGIAIGYPAVAEPENPSEQALAERELSARSRKPLNETVFCGSWGRAASLD